jgi:endonuclease YncB( thermonuclease family)
MCFGQFTGKVIKVTDGDTYKVEKASGGTVTVGLYDIDRPESDQSFGSKATRKASTKILHETVKVRKVERGPYGRMIAKVFYNGQSINFYLVSEGLAWVSGRYCNQRVCDHWKEIQAKRRANGTGLWSQSNPIPPWKYR